MKTPAFWRPGQGGVLALALAPLGWVYGALTARRMARPGWKAPVPVIGIGNFTAGGAGKTPTAIALAKMLTAAGESPFILTRGYGGVITGPVLVERQSAAEVGDEPLLLARAAPTVVARERVAGARFAIRHGATCLILDDGLQNPALHRDVSLAVVDGPFGVGNGRVLPAGPLRAPLAAQMPHVDAVLLVGTPHPGLLAALGTQVPVHGGTLEPGPQAQGLAGVPVIGFCGLGLPEKFEATLAATGAQVLASHRFADHHPYTPEEARTLLAQAEARGARLVTTAKDHVRLSGAPALEALAAQTTVLAVEMMLEDALLARIRRAVSGSEPAA